MDTVNGFRQRAEDLGAKVMEWTAVTGIMRDGERVTGVTTSKGRIDAPVVVLAAGAWAPGFCRTIGLNLPARAKCLDVVTVARPPELLTPHVTFRDYIQASTIRPESGVLTMAGVPCYLWDIDPDNAPTGSGAGFKITPAVGICMAELILSGKATTVDISKFGLDGFRAGRGLDGALTRTLFGRRTCNAPRKRVTTSGSLFSVLRGVLGERATSGMSGSTERKARQ